MEWLIEATIKETAAALEQGRMTSRELVLFYMKRIAEIDQAGPRLNSVLEINPDALHIAEALDRERQLTGARSLLHGIPVLIKDNINTHDKMHTSAGSLALADNYAPYDAFAVRKLREAGAVILGKTNLTEFANFMTENMPNGYSSRGGQVRNPYGPGRFDTGGSSSGSGVAVAANLCMAAVGTETSGSIISPACCSSIVGIKPTLGLISRAGIVPIAHSQDTAGPMARTVEDAAILLAALAGVDEEDPVTATGKGRIPGDYRPFFKSDGLQGKRIGVPRYIYKEMSEEEAEVMRVCIDEIRALGAEVIEDHDLEVHEKLQNYDVLIYEFKADMNAYLSTLGTASRVRTLKDIIAFNEAHEDIALKHGQTLLVQCENTTGTLTEPEYIKARLQDLELSQAQGMDRFMKEHHVDALLYPSTAGVSIAAKAGYPSIAVPAGYLQDGTPFGITFSAEAYSEPKLIELAYAYEQGTQKRVKPSI